MKFSKILVTLTSLVFATTLFAKNNVVPEVCPTEESLKNVGLEDVLSVESNIWWGINWNNNFETQDDWTLVVGAFLDVEDDEDALNQAKESLNNIQFAMGPIEVEDPQGETVYGCVYPVDLVDNLDYQKFAFTVTPSLDRNDYIKLHRIKKLIKQKYLN